MYYNPPSDRIDRLEVIKGSAAIKYGPQTMGGVINTSPKDLAMILEADSKLRQVKTDLRVSFLRWVDLEIAK